MQMLSITIPITYEGRTVASVLKERFDVSETYLRRLKTRPGSVLLNGEPVYVVARVNGGDTLAFDPSDGEPFPIRPIPFPLDIVFEDEWLIVVNKPKNLSVHPARDPNEPTVENALAAYFSGVDNPHPVSRLDKGTTGLLAVAKSGYIHALMKRQQADGRYRKKYLAILCGVPESTHFFIEAPIGAKPGSTYQREVRSDGAPAKSECTVLDTRNGLSLCELIPHTGRTHQLRVHTAYAGFPLLGDWLYGQRSETADRPLLHAASLSFEHPVTHAPVELTAPLPDDFLNYFPSEQ
jgi:RluA family pseudouridine synthase